MTIIIRLMAIIRLWGAARSLQLRQIPLGACNQNIVSNGFSLQVHRRRQVNMFLPGRQFQREHALPPTCKQPFGRTPPTTSTTYPIHRSIAFHVVYTKPASVELVLDIQYWWCFQLAPIRHRSVGLLAWMWAEMTESLAVCAGLCLLIVCAVHRMLRCIRAYSFGAHLGLGGGHLIFFRVHPKLTLIAESQA